MKRLAFVLTPLLLAPLAAFAAAEPSRPNVVLMIADDLGYRDLGCYGATKIKTPHIDQLAGEGARFTDAHSSCAVCNPSRYAILSGTYLWHAKRKPDYSLYFHEGQVTLPALLKSAGYRTAALGKWHNGFGRAPEPDWNAELKPGPLEIGFDSFFGTPRTHNEPPLVFVENHRVVGLDPADPVRVDRSPEYGPFGKMFGGEKAQAARPDDQIDFIMADKAAEFIGKQTKESPFFLYLAFAAPHVPINPAPEFRGNSEARLYGDYIQQLDHCTGLVLDALEKHGHAQNTIVLFTSDNGGMYQRDALESGHRCNGELLGQKTDAWEGGHRVPFIARWPGHIPAGIERKELFSQVDIMATLAEAANVKMPAGASPDGNSELAAFIDPAHAKPIRTEAVFLGTGGFALRQGDWVYIRKQGSCGLSVPEKPGQPWSQPYAKMGFVNSDVDAQGKIKPDAPKDQLYNLGSDVTQAKNLTLDHPARAESMRARLEELTRKPQASAAKAIPVETDPRLQADGKGWRLDKATVVDPTRPRVLLIGDSILNGYLKQVVRALDGKAYVDAWVNPYCQSEYLNKTLGEVLDQGPYDVVHFNMGLHGWNEGRIKPGTFEPLTRAYVQVIKDKLPKAKIIWANITPVTTKDKPTQLNAEINPIIIEHNRLAARVMAEMQVPTNDFYAMLINKLELARGDQFHWTAPAYEILAKTVSDSVLRELGAAKTADSN